MIQKDEIKEIYENWKNENDLGAELDELAQTLGLQFIIPVASKIPTSVEELIAFSLTRVMLHNVCVARYSALLSKTKLKNF